jgi:excisionase family DNA binding protein
MALAAAAARILTVAELCDYLRVNRVTVYRLLKNGSRPGFRVGSDWRFSVEEIDHWRLRQSAAQTKTNQ